jgi:hypothetical protein
MGIRKKETPHARRFLSTYSFRVSALKEAPEVKFYLSKLTKGDKTKFIVESLKTNFNLRHSHRWQRRSVFRELVRRNFSMIKHLLRVEGRKRQKGQDWLAKQLIKD